MASKRAMTDRELLSVIRANEQSALGAGGSAVGTQASSTGVTDTRESTLEIERAAALDRFNGRPQGDEQQDRSSVVMTPVRDAILFVLPNILRMFVGADDVIALPPRGPQDEAQAAQETYVVNYILMEQNNGFEVLYDFFFDALLLKNGYVTVYPEEETKKTFVHFDGVDEMTLTAIVQEIEQAGDEAEIVAKEEKPSIDPATQQPVMLYDVDIHRVRTEKRIRVECVAPENMLVSPRAHNKIKDAPFVEQIKRGPRSDLIEEGFDPDLVNRLKPVGGDFSIDALARDTVIDETSMDDSEDKSMDEVEVRRAYLRIDRDGDGVAELRRVTYGDDDIILEDEEVSEMPWASAVPLRMPHRHAGISLDDLLADIQQIQTTLTRQMLDNIYLNNNAVLEVAEGANVQDAVNRGPGRIIRSDVPGKINALGAPPILGELMGALSLIDKLKGDRVGVGEMNQGLNPEVLQDVTKAAFQSAQNAASSKMELIARFLAEGVKDIAILIHSAVIRHQDKPLTLKLRGQWTDVDPSTWQERTDVHVSVGLGANDHEQKRQNYMLLGQVQQAAAQSGIVGPQQVYNLAAKITKTLGESNADDYFMDPKGQAYQQAMQQKQHQPNPQLQAQMKIEQAKAQAKLQVEQAKLQQKAQSDASRTHADILIEQAKQQAQMQSNAADREMKAQTDAAQALIEAKSNYDKMMLDFAARIALADAKAGGDVGPEAMGTMHQAEQEFPNHG